MNAGRQEVRDVIERAGHRRATSGERHDPVPGRDPPLQQGTAGHPAARRRGGAGHARGRDHREPLLRGELGAAVALPRLRAARRLAMPTCWRCCGGRSATSAGCPTRPRWTTTRWSSWPRGRAATPAPRWLPWSWPARRRTASGSRSSAAEDALQRRAVLYDKGGDRHYDTISAWIKATRGSDPDASLLYLAEMLEGGEDPRFIARRMVILASEDIGNADPRALPVAVAAAHAVEHVGLPECAHNLAQAGVYLALAPKSNASYQALGRARAVGARPRRAGPACAAAQRRLPGRRALGRGQGYDYPHDHPEGVSGPGADARRGRGRALPGAVGPRRGARHAGAPGADSPRTRRQVATRTTGGLAARRNGCFRAVMRHWPQGRGVCHRGGMARDPGRLRLADPGTLLATTHQVGGGMLVRLRLARPSDAARMAAFLGRLEPEILHGPLPARRCRTPPPSWWATSPSTTPASRMVVVATTMTDLGEEIVGLAGLSLPDSGVGGLAVVVDEAAHGLGVGKLLTEAAAALALRQGAGRLRASCPEADGAMHAPDVPAGAHGPDRRGRRPGGPHPPAAPRPPSRLARVRHNGGDGSRRARPAGVVQPDRRAPARRGAHACAGAGAGGRGRRGRGAALLGGAPGSPSARATCAAPPR